MDKKFDYRSSLHLIKSGLFDIYEDQEKVIGTIDNDKERNTHLDDFINLKNIALMLIEGIEYLYQENEEEISEKQTIDDKAVHDKKKDKTKLEVIGNSKYYLDCDESKLPFAYVPEQLYEKLKKSLMDNYNEVHRKKIKDKEEIQEDEISVVEEDKQSSQPIQLDDNKKADSKYIYKEDETKVRGIIVRSDQFMKLSLSRMRQEGVLAEAKDFRRKEITRRRREEHQKKLKESEVKLNI